MIFIITTDPENCNRKPHHLDFVLNDEVCTKPIILLVIIIIFIFRYSTTFLLNSHLPYDTFYHRILLNVHRASQ